MCGADYKFAQQSYNRFFSSKKSKTLNVGMCGVYPEAMDWNIALRTQFSFWVSVSEEKALSEPENLQNLAKFLKCFWIQLQICLPKNLILVRSAIFQSIASG